MAGPRDLAGSRRTGSRRFDERKKHPPPYGNGLLVEVIANDDFFQAALLEDAPAIVADESDDRTMQLVDWNRLGDLLRWFASGCLKDNSANLVFNHSLNQHHRSHIHRLADEIGLDSFSQGVGRGRHCSLYAKGKAPVKAVIDDITQKKAKLLYKLAKLELGEVASRDECAEMLAENKLTPELQQLWDTEGQVQLAIVELNQCASRGNLQGLKEAIQQNPELVQSGKREAVSTLTPLNCAAAQGHVTCLEALIEAGAPLEAEDGFGQTALQASRAFEQMDAEGILIRAGAYDKAESVDSMPSQSDLAEFMRALPRGQKQSSTLIRLDEDDTAMHGLNRAVRSSFEELSQVPREENEDGNDGPGEEGVTEGVEQVELDKKRSSSQKSWQAQSGSGMLNPATGALLFGHAITRRQTGELALNSSVNMDMRRDYEASPDLKGDPMAATRGTRGAAAMALGRRIMESATHAEARRHRVSDGGDATDVVTQRSQQAANSNQPRAASQTLQSLWNPLNQPVSLSSARMNGRHAHGKQTSQQRINAWMESASEEHSAASAVLTHSVSNPALHAQEAQALARADSAPENESEHIGDPEFTVKGDHDLYNEIDALGSTHGTEKQQVN